MPDSTSTNPVRNSPVTLLGAGHSVLMAVLTFLATQGDLGAKIDVGQTTQVLAPLIAAAIPAIFHALNWNLVSPYAKVKAWLGEAQAEADTAKAHVEYLLTKTGLLSDADITRLEALMEAKFGNVVLNLGAAHPDAEAVGPPVGDTMSAGQPGSSFADPPGEIRDPLNKPPA